MTMTQEALAVPMPSERPTVGLLEAAKWLGMSRGKAYDLNRRGEFPLPVIAAGERGYRVPTAALRRLLQLDGDGRITAYPTPSPWVQVSGANAAGVTPSSPGAGAP